MFPHGRSLVKQLEKRPFAFIGVNTDFDRELVKRVVQQEQINWRSFWSGGSDDSITQTWQIQALPTIFVLDANGLIRFKNLHGQDLDCAVEELLKEVEKPGS